MLKKVTFRTPNKMLIHTGHATFDRQADCLGTGNVIGKVQLSFYIRPYSETECNGRTNSPGHLREYDLHYFQDLPSSILQVVKNLTVDKPVILYEIRHWRGEQKTVHGYIITDAKHHLLRVFITGPTAKSQQVINGVLPYLAEDVREHQYA